MPQPAGRKSIDVERHGVRLVGNIQTLFHATADDEVLKGTFASVTLEHYEIASYKSLMAMAEACNERSVAEVCRQNLREEEAMAQFLDSNIEQVTRAYLDKASSGSREPVRYDKGFLVKQAHLTHVSNSARLSLTSG